MIIKLYLYKIGQRLNNLQPEMVTEIPKAAVTSKLYNILHNIVHIVQNM